MIFKDDSQTRLEFGTGDICIASGFTGNEDNKAIGFVIFENQEPREIGSVGAIKSGLVNLEEYPIVMTFSKKESIDVVIKHLEEAKSYMDIK